MGNTVKVKFAQENEFQNAETKNKASTSAAKSNDEETNQSSKPSLRKRKDVNYCESMSDRAREESVKTSD